MILAKATNLETGAQSDPFYVCSECYGTLDEAIHHANVQVGTDIALCTVEEDVVEVCSECGKKSETDA